MSGALALECRRVWHKKVQCFLVYECLSVWHSGTGVPCGLAPNPTGVEGSGTHLVVEALSRLGAIRLQDCVQLCTSITGLPAITQYGYTMGFSLIAGLRAITQKG